MPRPSHGKTSPPLLGRSPLTAAARSRTAPPPRASLRPAHKAQATHHTARPRSQTALLSSARCPAPFPSAAQIGQSRRPSALRPTPLSHGCRLRFPPAPAFAAASSPDQGPGATRAHSPPASHPPAPPPPLAPKVLASAWKPTIHALCPSDRKAAAPGNREPAPANRFLDPNPARIQLS